MAAGITHVWCGLDHAQSFFHCFISHSPFGLLLRLRFHTRLFLVVSIFRSSPPFFCIHARCLPPPRFPASRPSSFSAVLRRRTGRLRCRPAAVIRSSDGMLRSCCDETFGRNAPACEHERWCSPLVLGKFRLDFSAPLKLDIYERQWSCVPGHIFGRGIFG